MKKILALMIGCALSGSLFAAHKPGKGGGNPVDGSYVDEVAAEVRTQLLARTNGAGPVGPSYGKASTCAAEGGNCLVFPTHLRVAGDMTILSSNVYGIAQPTVSGIAAANELCAGEGRARFGTPYFQAWLSTDTHEARYILRRGVVYVTYLRSLFARYDWLVTNVGFRGEQVLETPLMFNDIYAWTGTSQGGTPSGEMCNNWTSAAAAASGTVGLTSAVDEQWTAAATMPCDGMVAGVLVGLALICHEVSP
ncbi:MAG: hypothetical protein K0U37_07515 [Gammaproteobacteria bacterium]|nr:hypothetical protein [Gammaproteobacteria bacterium]